MLDRTRSIYELDPEETATLNAQLDAYEAVRDLRNAASREAELACRYLLMTTGVHRRKGYFYRWDREEDSMFRSPDNTLRIVRPPAADKPRLIEETAYRRKGHFPDGLHVNDLWTTYVKGRAI